MTSCGFDVHGEIWKEKGAIGAVTDAVLDAGDLLIDGATGIFGWLRGDAPPEDDGPVGADAARALSNGPSGAAYGISQASPTGGVNAVCGMENVSSLGLPLPSGHVAVLC